MKDKYKRTILRLELDVETNGKEIELLKTRVEVDGAARVVAEAKLALESLNLVERRAKLEAQAVEYRTHLDAVQGELIKARDVTAQAETDAEEARGERDGVQEENEELRQTFSKEREDWRQERGILEFRIQDAEAQLHAARQSGHQRLGG